MKNKLIFILALIALIGVGFGVTKMIEKDNSIDEYIKDISSKSVILDFDEEVTKLVVKVSKGSNKEEQIEIEQRSDLGFVIDLKRFKNFNSLFSFTVDCLDENDKVVNSFSMDDILLSTDLVNEDIGKARYLFVDPWYYDRYTEILDKVDKKKIELISLKFVHEDFDASLMKDLKNISFIHVQSKSSPLNLESLSSLNQLRVLIVNNTMIESTSFLEGGFKNLKTLNAEFEDVDFDEINKHSKLENLFIRSSEYKNHLKLPNLIHLQVGALKNNDVEILSEIDSSPLESLFIYGDFSGDLDKLPKLDQLKTFYLASKNFTEEDLNCEEKAVNVNICEIKTLESYK